QPTTEVAIAHTMREDVYLVLTGYDERTQLANFRVYINPLINWVWLGFMVLMIGTAICLVPQSVVNRINGRSARTDEGSARPARRASEAALILLVAGGLTLAFAAPAAAQPAEHEDEAAVRRGGHEVGQGEAHLYRPDSATAEKLMKELVCLCGGCQRENILECRCGYAAQERQKVLALLAAHDLSTDAGQKAGYDAVVETFIAEYGGRHVLSTPQNKASWMIPYAAIGGGLVLLFGMGRRLVRRGRSTMASAASSAAPVSKRDDEEYNEILDDELRDTD
ncbi:MAG TPA: cytochrome c-type biogenesis CcmF C-terminal domain-containing protein, partial [Haliangium sp.]|nr:cytochrome c-type biogenesis CcmF C-terminal domain-containing protein [Haliangium sp.]